MGTKKWIPWPAGADCTGKTSALEGGACRMLRGLRVGMRESSQRKPVISVKTRNTLSSTVIFWNI